MASVENLWYRAGLSVIAVFNMVGCNTPEVITLPPTVTPKPTVEPKQHPEGKKILQFGMFHRQGNLFLINQSGWDIEVSHSGVKHWVDHCPISTLSAGVVVLFRSRLPGSKPYEVNRNLTSTGISFGLESISPATLDVVNEIVHQQLTFALCRDVEVSPDSPRMVSVLPR